MPFLQLTRTKTVTGQIIRLYIIKLDAPSTPEAAALRKSVTHQLFGSEHTIHSQTEKYYILAMSLFNHRAIMLEPIEVVFLE